MTDEIRHDKKVTVVLDTPLTNIGKYDGGKYDHRNSTTVFYGKVEVDEATAQDLLRRQAEYKDYEKNLIRDNGVKNYEAGKIV